MTLRVLTVLPPRERYGTGAAGAISLLVSRLARPSDIVVGSSGGEDVLPGGAYRAMDAPRLPLPARWRYGLAAVSMMRACRPDVTDVHNRPDLARLLARFGPVRLILHNDPLGMRGAKTIRQRRDLARHVLVCGVSDWVCARFRQGCPEVCTEVQPNCVDMAELPRAPVRRRRVLFAGRVVSDKGVDAFVRAWGAVRSRFSEWDAVVMGADRFGPDSPETPFLASLRQAAAAAGISMTGYRPHKDVLEAMAEAAIVVVPSRWQEPFGMTALEAMGCGAAVIASPVGALPDVVGDAALLAHPDEPGALEHALCRLMEDAPLRAALRAKGSERARRVFGVEAVRARSDLLRREAIALHGRRGR